MGTAGRRVRRGTAVLSWIAVAVVAVATAVAAPQSPQAPQEDRRPGRPQVVSLEPAHGATRVSPDVTQIRVVFDRDMDTSSYSWTGGGDTFPELAGRPEWVDARTCTLPVRLADGQDVRMGVNSTRHTGFRSADGVPAAQQPLFFHVGGTGDPDTAPRTEADNRAVLAALRAAVDDHYSHRDVYVDDWDALVDRHAGNVAAAPTIPALAAAVHGILQETRDMHVTVRTADETLSVYPEPADVNFDLDAVRRTVPDLEQRSPVVWTGTLEGGHGYILIASWSRAAAEHLEPAWAALEDFADAPGLVVDVRPNGGGDEMLAREFAGCFLPVPADPDEQAPPRAYGPIRVRDPEADGGWSEPHLREFARNPDRPAWTGPVAVLHGRGTASSCEAFVLMMGTIEGCVTVGAPTRGASGNPRPHDLGGITVLLPSWQVYADLAAARAGTSIERVGVPPDEPVDARPTADGPDPVLARALEVLEGD